MPDKDQPTDKAEAARLAAEAAASASAAAASAGAAAASAGAAVAAGAAVIGRAANSALDAVEKLLFGKVGGAEEAVEAEREADPLARLRRQYGRKEPSEPAQPRPDPEAEARAQLEALKAARKARLEDPDVKKTL